jgi:hypothetical protein
MPHTTHAYPFEAKVAALAHQLCQQLSSGAKLRSFLLLLDERGNVRSLTFDSLARLQELVQEARQSGTPHLFFDPLDDGREYIWLSWEQISQSTLECLTGQPFVDSDFVPFARLGARVQEPPQTFPHSWGVMF